jgi:diaminopimelate epimerase
MKNLSFTKMSGAGNDFIVIDKNKFPGFAVNPSLIRKLCDRRNGIGADGLITIEKKPEFDFEMAYYNADGSTGSLCGNGARCAIKFALLNGLINGSVTDFICEGVEYSGAVLNEDLIQFNLNKPSKIDLNVLINVDNTEIKLSSINTGSPHAVIYINDFSQIPEESEKLLTKLNTFPVVELGRKIRNHEHFAPAGTNVNFLMIHNNQIYIRTYERGVEDETLACGTGSVAAAVISNLKFGLQPPIKLISKSGEELSVNFNYRDSEFTDISLTGPAKIIFTGEIDLEKFT